MHPFPQEYEPDELSKAHWLDDGGRDLPTPPATPEIPDLPGIDPLPEITDPPPTQETHP